MYTVQNVIEQSNKFSMNPNLLSKAIDIKSQIQEEAIGGYSFDNPTSKFMSIEDRVLSEGRFCLANMQKTDENIFCVALSIGTILKEINDDTSFVSNQSIANYMNHLINR